MDYRTSRYKEPRVASPWAEKEAQRCPPLPHPQGWVLYTVAAGRTLAINGKCPWDEGRYWEELAAPAHCRSLVPEKSRPQNPTWEQNRFTCDASLAPSMVKVFETPDPSAQSSEGGGCVWMTSPAPPWSLMINNGQCSALHHLPANELLLRFLLLSLGIFPIFINLSR